MDMRSNQVPFSLSRGFPHYICDFCGDIFHFESALNRHYVIHNQNRNTISPPSPPSSFPSEVEYEDAFGWESNSELSVHISF
jgi:hypothetical protein